ncbi:HAMP domain-containing sensor histidine kinase [Persicobacter psychrovividus]|uniref:histidine kinase n=1 Tax=Persicobacter psychrovividus TaxID=387638 RepID=A0ABM7VD00_9BACT|nr:hypothetical protein PEPS_10930 [Persicobacter psychrovividus]
MNGIIRLFSQLTGTDSKFTLAEKVVNIIALIMVSAALINGLLHSTLQLPKIYLFAFSYLVVANSLVLILNRYLRKFNWAVLLFLSSEVVIFTADFVAMGGIVGPSPLLLICFHVINYNLLDNRKHGLYFIFSTLLIIALVKINLLFPEISAPMQDALPGRIGQLITVNTMTSISLWLFKRQDNHRAIRLKDTNEDQQQLIEAIENDFFIVKFDDDLNIRYKSASVDRILGPMRASKQLDLLRSLVRPQEGDTIYESDFRAFQQRVYLRINQKHLRNKKNGAFVQLIVQNITTQKEHEKQLMSSLKKELEINKMKNEFIAMVSHQFRTPLTTIYSAIEILQLHSGEENAFAKRKYDQVFHSVNSLTVMMERLLDFGKLEANEVQIKPVQLDMVSFIHTILDKQKFSESKDRIQFSANVEQLIVYADTYLMEHILGNLLSNAIKYSPNGDRVSLRLSASKKHYNISVTDQGIGIAQKEIPKLFNPFFRAKNTENIKGTGIGLAFVKQFVELHHGTVTVMSELGKGTTFMIKFPLEEGLPRPVKKFNENQLSDKRILSSKNHQ